MSDEEWAFVAPYLILLPLDAEQRKHDLREVFNAVALVGARGSALALSAQRFPALGKPSISKPSAGSTRARSKPSSMTCGSCCAWPRGATPKPSAAIFDGRTVQSTPESGARAGYDGHKRKRVEGPRRRRYLGSPPGLARYARPTSRNGPRWIPGDHHPGGDRPERGRLPSSIKATPATSPRGRRRNTASSLVVVKLPEAKKGFVLLPKRWVVERSFAWAARFRRLAKDYERLQTTLVGMHFIAFACLLLPRLLSHQGS